MPLYDWSVGCIISIGIPSSVIRVMVSSSSILAVVVAVNLPMMKVALTIIGIESLASASMTCPHFCNLWYADRLQHMVRNFSSPIAELG